MEHDRLHGIWNISSPSDRHSALALPPKEVDWWNKEGALLLPEMKGPVRISPHVGKEEEEEICAK